MTKKLVLLFSVVLFIGSLFFFAYPEKKEEQPAETLTAGALAGQVKEASRLYKRLAKTLEADQVKLCFEGEELACAREGDLADILSSGRHGSGRMGSRYIF